MLAPIAIFFFGYLACLFIQKGADKKSRVRDPYS